MKTTNQRKARYGEVPKATGWFVRESSIYQYRPEKRLDDCWYVAKFNSISNERVPMSGMNTCWTHYERDEAVKYANRINRANGYYLCD